MSDILKQAIGSRVRYARERLKLTQEDLATRISKTPESVSNIERSVHLPALDTLIDLAKVLDLDLMEIIEVAGIGRVLSKERAQQEAQIALTVRNLSDTAIGIAAQQITALEKIK